MPHSTKYNPWFKEHVDVFNFLIPPQELVILDGKQVTDTYAFFLYQFHRHFEEGKWYNLCILYLFDWLFVFPFFSFVKGVDTLSIVVTGDTANPIMTLEKYVPKMAVVDKKRKNITRHVEQFFDMEANESKTMEVDEDANFSLVNVEEFSLLHPAKRVAADILPGIKDSIAEFAAANDGQPAINLHNICAGLVYRGEKTTTIIPMGASTLEYVNDMISIRYQNKSIHIPDSDVLGADSEVFGADEEKGENIEEH